MFPILTKLLGGSSLAAYVVAGLLAAGALTSAYWYTDHRGYARAQAYYEAKIGAMKAAAATASLREIERQDAANNAAKQAEARSIAEMQAASQSLENRTMELQREADQDPAAGVPALGAASVRRINEVR